ncbi:protein FAR1-RELATED SEQUENCE 5-like [Salvia splendens]|uniref:protein FAR1-RELATED SEQUENCE 5-like n=1 Tax=Salvia splendens TaxID=180675 RepID=UPI001C2698A8|nr:protein FAR1-RELATED SEQUENCE 5-like [Salvia splendens]
MSTNGEDIRFVNMHNSCMQNALSPGYRASAAVFVVDIFFHHVVGPVIPICKAELRPYEGQKFSSLEEGICFYEKYAQEACFDFRRFGNRSSGGVITFQYVVCNRQGFHTVDPLDVDVIISDDVNVSDDDEVTSKKKRRRGTKRCGCGARISFKFYSDCGVKYYLVHQFIEEHNHAMVDKDHKRFMKGNRSMNDVHHKFVEDCTKANIGPTSTFNLLKEFFGGYDVVGCTLNDVRNCSRDIKEKLKEVDVQMILNQMQEKKRICEGFFYKYQLSPDDNKLVSLFWSDAESRKHYHMFGDVVAFDTTYSTNRYRMVFGPFTGKDNHGCPIAFGAGFVSSENCDAFSWLFTVFVECMGVAPRIIITDQDWGMRLAIEKVLSDTRHRLCMWHIMSKLFEKIPKSISNREQFSKEFKACVWSELVDPEEFDILWTGIVEKYGMGDHKWFKDMFVVRHMWIPAYFRDVPMGSLMRTTSFSESENSFFKRYSKPLFNFADFTLQYNNAIDAQRNQTEKLDYYDSVISPKYATDLAFEKQLASVYTDRMFRVVQELISEADKSCQMISMSTLENIEVFKVSDARKKTFTVTHEKETESFDCECKLFERCGYLCSHLFFVLRNKDVNNIPEKYVGNRWLKSDLLKAVHGLTSDESALGKGSNEDDKLQIGNRCHGRYFGLYQCAFKNKNHLIALDNLLAGIAPQIFTDDTTGSSSVDKNDSIMNIYGIAVPEDITAHAPDVVSTKGGASDKKNRIKSSIEKAIEKASY